MNARSLFLTAAMAIGVGLLSPGGSAQSPAGPSLAFVENELLVQFRGGTTSDHRANARQRVGGARADLVLAADRRSDGKGDLEVMRIPPGLAVAAAARELALDSAVEFAEPNWIYHHEATSNDPYYTNGSLWGMYGDTTTPANQFGSQAGEAWARGTTGRSNVYVGIIDEGVMGTHPDLADNMWKNPLEVANGIDDDGNGYVDDLTGWDFDANNNSTFDGNADDHGTHVAGTIGAVGNNNVGVAGMNWDVTMIPAKFLGRRGGTTANAIKALDYLTDLKQRHGLNLVATNNSWGGGGFSQALLDAINRSGDKGILFVAAAGNGGSDGVGDNNDTVANYPSNYTCSSSNGDCVIAVAAIASNGTLASFSNFGLTKVDIGAPGVGIYSTLPGRGGTATYGSYSGTSMATPHVTGAVALYAATHAGESAAQIKAAILLAAVPTAALNGKTVTGGRLNVSGF
jgi:thermitase